MSIILLVSILVTFIVAFSIGRQTGLKSGSQLGRKEAIAELENQDPKPICACKHNYAYHDENGTCHGVDVSWEKGEPILSPSGTYVVARRNQKRIETPCRCKRYTGPEPLPTYIP